MRGVVRMGNKVKKILVLRTEHIGDYVLSVPALKMLRDKFPEARIDIVVGKWNKTLAERTPYVDNVIVFDNPFIERHIGRFKILRELFFNRRYYSRFFRKVNGEKYDLLVDFSGRKISFLLNKRIVAKRKILGAKFDFGEIREFERAKKVLGFGNVERVGFGNVELEVLEGERKKVERLIGKGDFVVVHPITPLEEKNWPLEKWGSLIGKLDGRVFLIGGSSDKEDIDFMIKKFGLEKKCKNFCGLSLIESYYLISKARLFVGGDSGPMHLAELARTPVVALFGPTDEKVWGPVGEGDFVLKREGVDKIKVDEVLGSCKLRV